MDEPTEQRSRIEAITARIKMLEHDLEVEFVKRRVGLRFGIEKGRIVFEEEILRRHRELKIGLLAYVARTRPLILLTAPIIYALVVPLVLLDVCVSIYQAICFPVYRIPKVKRSDYFNFDHAHLAYLNSLQKFNCAYCSYANGLLGYIREIGGRSEAYWCPIKHARRVIGAHEQYTEFVDYGDADAFRENRKRANERN